MIHRFLFDIDPLWHCLPWLLDPDINVTNTFVGNLELFIRFAYPNQCNLRLYIFVRVFPFDLTPVTLMSSFFFACLLLTLASFLFLLQIFYVLALPPVQVMAWTGEGGWKGQGLPTLTQRKVNAYDASEAQPQLTGGRVIDVSLIGAVVLSLLLCAEPQSRYIIVLLKKFKKEMKFNSSLINRTTSCNTGLRHVVTSQPMGSDLSTLLLLRI